MQALICSKPYECKAYLCAGATINTKHDYQTLIEDISLTITQDFILNSSVIITLTNNKPNFQKLSTSPLSMCKDYSVFFKVSVDSRRTGLLKIEKDEDLALKIVGSFELKLKGAFWWWHSSGVVIPCNGSDESLMYTEVNSFEFKCLETIFQQASLKTLNDRIFEHQQILSHMSSMMMGINLASNSVILPSNNLNIEPDNSNMIKCESLTLEAGEIDEICKRPPITKKLSDSGTNQQRSPTPNVLGTGTGKRKREEIEKDSERTPQKKFFFDNRTDATAIPDSIQTLYISSRVSRVRDNSYLTVKHIPASVTQIHFYRRYDQPIHNLIPESVTHIFFNDDYNCPIYGHDKNNIDIVKFIPNTVTHIVFGRNFNQDLGQGLPALLESLTLGTCFNRKVEKCFPSSLTYLKFGFDFNQNINNAFIDFPNSKLHHLVFGELFNQYINNAIPPNVSKLVFGTCFNQEIFGSLPPNLIELIFGDRFDKSIAYSMPLKLETLEFGKDFNQVIGGIGPNGQCSYLPESLITLAFGRNFDQPLGSLNPNIKLYLPNTLEKLVFGYKFNQSVEFFIPDNTKNIYFGICFKQSVRSLPRDKRLHFEGERISRARPMV